MSKLFILVKIIFCDLIVNVCYFEWDFFFGGRVIYYDLVWVEI